MIKKLLYTFMFFTIILQANAFEDSIITTNGKLSNIKIEDNTIIEIYPLITIMNEKNTIIVQPLKEGFTTFTVMKNGKQEYKFEVNVNKKNTQISNNEGFEILSLDIPPQEELEFLDFPPEKILEVE